MLSEIKKQLKELKMVLARRWAAGFIACCVVMTQGNLMGMLNAKHLLTAGNTGLVATILIFAGMIVGKDKVVDKSYREGALIGAAVMVSDTVVHPAHFWGEPVLTGIIAMAVAWAISKIVSIYIPKI